MVCHTGYWNQKRQKKFSLLCPRWIMQKPSNRAGSKVHAGVFGFSLHLGGPSEVPVELSWWLVPPEVLSLCPLGMNQRSLTTKAILFSTWPSSWPLTWPHQASHSLLGHVEAKSSSPRCPWVLGALLFPRHCGPGWMWDICKSPRVLSPWELEDFLT